jgi:hypothetical protein
MVPFDTWVMNGDRENKGNLIISEDTSGSVPLLRVAYIDFANSLVRVFAVAANIWRDETTWVVPYPAGVPIDIDAMSSTVTRIQALAPEKIRGVVERVPPTFLLPKHRDEIAEALLYRQSRLRGMMRRKYPALP